MPFHRLAGPAIAALVLLAPRTAVVRAETASDLFDAGTLHEVRLFIHSQDLARLRADFSENTYYPADLSWGGLRVRNVGVRSRGLGSRNPHKIGLHVDFDRFTAGRRFLGLRQLVLDNNWTDPVMMRERLASAFFNRMGHPAPRAAYTRLYINHVYQGLYTLVEAVDEQLLERSLGERDGYLFEYRWLRPFYAEDLGDDLDAYKPMFEPRTHERAADTVLYAPIRDLFREINAPHDVVWRERVEALIDVPQFITQIAIEQFLAESDGILGSFGMSNFYLYRSARTNRHLCIPWDKDNCFSSMGESVLRGSDENVLARRLLAYGDLRALFLEILEQCARAAAEDDWLLGEILRDSALVAPAALDDPRKQYSNEEFRDGVEFLKAFAATRPAIVLAEIAALRSCPAQEGAAACTGFPRF